ncbi:cotranscriptional regulator FAM172A-like [Actinia tenebrosa]|uniref:Cotranscriptional regulator FAM172A-like n=1 Tax=Actinia tenebrosa TaxID=6105 RepID=A0A6P8HBF1_ACTTE|nr:cotranscriptional regulator FAM172A-like [Actinia tenebrosa]
MVPYIETALKEGFGVIITNGNDNVDSNNRPIQGSESAQDHFVYVWNNFIKKAKAEHIVIVAHSFGGVVVLHGLRNIKEAKERIKAVAFTDSVHSVGHYESSDIKQFFKERTRNWVSSREPLDTPIRSYYEGDTCELVSAGTTESVWTSHCAKDSVFRFFKEKLDKEEKGKAVQEVFLPGNLKLLKIAIPVDAGKKDPQGFFFMSEYALSFKKLIILMHGGGAVRAGQWSRSVIINENHESGTMVPYIEKALEEGFGVIITNGAAVRGTRD